MMRPAARGGARGVLFLRALPAPSPADGVRIDRRSCIGRRRRLGFQAAFLCGPNGAVWPGPGLAEVTAFWVGSGRRVRTPGQELLAGLRSGTITDVADFGCAGALDPALRRGDLVLATATRLGEGGAPLELPRRSEATAAARVLAGRHGLRLVEAPVLTTGSFVLSRPRRLELGRRSGCAAVEMEHGWFARVLAGLLPPEVFAALRFTHLVQITDAVPAADSPAAAVRVLWDAGRGYFLQRRAGLWALREELLHLWLGGATDR